MESVAQNRVSKLDEKDEKERFLAFSRTLDAGPPEMSLFLSFPGVGFRPKSTSRVVEGRQDTRKVVKKSVFLTFPDRNGVGPSSPRRVLRKPEKSRERAFSQLLSAFYPFEQCYPEKGVLLSRKK